MNSPTILYHEDARTLLCTPRRPGALDVSFTTGHRCGQSQRDSQHPFYPTSKRDLIVLIVKASRRGWSESHAIPTSMIRSWIRDRNLVEKENWIPRCPPTRHDGLSFYADVQGKLLTYVNVERARKDRLRLRVDSMDYSSVWRQWVDDQTCVLSTCEKTHTAYTEAILQAVGGGALVLIPDHAVLQEVRLDEPSSYIVLTRVHSTRMKRGGRCGRSTTLLLTSPRRRSANYVTYVHEWQTNESFLIALRDNSTGGQ